VTLSVTGKAIGHEKFSIHQFQGAGGRQAFANSGNSMGIAHYRRFLKIYFSAIIFFILEFMILLVHVCLRGF
jgi:hypothetical protein